jgi:hypothetical protein
VDRLDQQAKNGNALVAVETEQPYLRTGMRLHGGDLDDDEAGASRRTSPVEGDHALRRRPIAVDKAGEADGQPYHTVPQQQARNPQRLEHQGTLLHRGSPSPVCCL